MIDSIWDLFGRDTSNIFFPYFALFNLFAWNSSNSVSPGPPSQINRTEKAKFFPNGNRRIGCAGDFSCLEERLLLVFIFKVDFWWIELTLRWLFPFMVY